MTDATRRPGGAGQAVPPAGAARLGAPDAADPAWSASGRAVRVERVDAPGPALVERLLRIWVAVSNAGGWVGFVPPVGPDDVRPALEANLARVAAGSDWLVVVREDDAPSRGVEAGSTPRRAGVEVPGPAAARDAAAADDVVGFAFVADNDRLLSEHWRWVLRVQVDPARQGERLGQVLLDGITAMAAEAGLEMLLLTVRGGEGLEGFYARAGFHEVARIPRAIRVAPGDERDQVILSRELAPGPRAEAVGQV